MSEREFPGRGVEPGPKYQRSTMLGAPSADQGCAYGDSGFVPRDVVYAQRRKLVEDVLSAPPLPPVCRVR